MNNRNEPKQQVSGTLSESEKGLVSALPKLLKDSPELVFKVNILKEENGEILVDKELEFKNVNDQFDYLWNLPSNTELIYISTTIDTKRICYRGKNLSVVFDKINGEPKMVLYEETGLKINSKPSARSIQNSVDNLRAILRQGNRKVS